MMCIGAYFTPSVAIAFASGATGQRSAAKSASAGVTTDSRPGHLVVIVAVALGLAIVMARSASAEGDKNPDGAAAASSYQIGGHCDCIARHAYPSNTPAYGGYYVGGGAPCHGDERFADEGTWGWDYFGRAINRHIALGWWHGAHDQGGIGAYKTDGPKLLHER